MLLTVAASGLVLAGLAEASARSRGFAGPGFAARPTGGVRAGYGARFGRQAGFLRFEGRGFRGAGRFGQHRRFGHGRGPGREGYSLAGFGGYGFAGAYGGLAYGDAGYASPRLPLPREPGLPVAAGIPAPAVLPPAIYVIAPKSSRVGASSRRSGRAVAARSDDATGESGVVSSGPRVTRLR
ncbi:hypothetical protein [uncultured Enterovirga sp.]|uniref:hypothetical protein n=1 Tax=uncultured Enterovirga sp. TaxID=2026352 RepID=UPI0035CC43C6